MTHEVRWGIIGAGGIARRRTMPAFEHVGTARLVALMDVAPSGLVDLSKRYEVPSFYTTVDDLLSDREVDAVYLASPVEFHREQALQVIAAGKHLLVEKPLAKSLTATEEVAAAAQTRPDLIVRPAMSMRYHSGHEKIRTLIRSGKLGQIVSIRAQLACLLPPDTPNWRLDAETAGGGALMDMGIHCIDLASYLLDARPTSVMALTDVHTAGYQVEDRALAILTMSDGSAVMVDNYYSVPDVVVRNVLEIYGTRGGVMAQGTMGQEGAGTVDWWTSREGLSYDSAQGRRDDGGWQELSFTAVDPYAAQLASFDDAVLGRPSEGPDVADATSVAAAIEGAYRSHRSGSRVDLSHTLSLPLNTRSMTSATDPNNGPLSSN